MAAVRRMNVVGSMREGDGKETEGIHCCSKCQQSLCYWSYHRMIRRLDYAFLQDDRSEMMHEAKGFFGLIE